MAASPTLNLGIVAHVDAGKTSLTERLLLEAGVIDELGSVDAGSTQTDTLALERQRGITIRAAVVSLELGPPDSRVTVNIVDTPGHSDFIAEVERSLAVLDGAVLVISAVEGVQAQTRLLMRVLRRLRIPTILYVNKIDRMGARPEALLTEIADRRTPRAVAMGEVIDAGTSSAAYVPYAADTAFRERLAEALVDGDDALLAAWVDRPESVPTEWLLRALAEQTAEAAVHPVFFGSAITGAGVAELTAGLTWLLPVRCGEPVGPLAGTVFKVDRGPAGEKTALVDLRSGTLRVRDRVPVSSPGQRDGTRRVGPGGPDAFAGRPGREERVTAIGVYEHGSVARRAAATAGRIVRVVGLEGARVGDLIGDPARGRPLTREFAPPTLETVVEPRDPADRGRLHTALTRLAEQDPLIALRQDDARGEITVSLYGEVQKEVIEAILAVEHDVHVAFRESTVICIERVVGTGAAFEIIDTPSNPYLATVGLRVEPASAGSGTTTRLEVELGSMPAAFFRAVEETVHRTLDQGLHGWEVRDCVVSITHSGYWPRQSHMHATFDKTMSSTAGDFRNLTPLVLMEALRRAGTLVEEPVHRFDFDLPSDVLGQALTALAHVRAVPRETEVRGSVTHLSGEVPAGRVHELQRRVPALTRGQGDLVCVFEGYHPVSGLPPERPRTDFDPLHRREYLLRVAGKL